MSTAHILSLLFAVVSAAVYITLAYRLDKRVVRHGAEARAWRMFVAWWVAMGGVSLVGGGLVVAAALGIERLSLYVALTQLNLLFITFGLAALLHYIVFVYTGKEILVLLAPAYAGLFTYLTFVLFDRQPTGIDTTGSRVQLVYQDPMGRSDVVVLLALLLVPQLIGSLGYLLLAREARDRTQRYRIVVVAASILIWFGASIISGATGAADSTVWPVVSRVLGVAAPLAVYQAYYPLPLLQRKLRISPLNGADMALDTGRQTVS